MINDLKKKKKKKGFTLVEVIIVLAIIAIIAAIAIPNLTKVRQDSKKKADVQTCETIKRTVETLIVDGTIGYSTDTTTPSTIVIAGGGAATTDNITLPTGVTLDTYFNKVKVPQQDDGKDYLVTITETGDIASVVARDTATNSIATATK